MDPKAQPDVAARIQAILADVVERRAAGAELPDEAVLADHSELGDALRMALAALHNGEGVQRERATILPSGTTDRLGETIDHSPSPGDSRPSVHVHLQDHLSAQEAQRFRKLRPFAAGGVGELWIALDMQLNREVALKELQERHQEVAHKRDRFLVEGQITGVLEHPGIVPVYALGVNDSQYPYYAMRLVRGETLRQAIKAFHAAAQLADKFTRNDLDFRNLLRRFADVCITVAYAHSRGVLHRDLKPDNVMLGKYGETYVVDWGMARVVGSRAEEFSLVSEEVVRPAHWNAGSATRYGSVMGTPGYMSPEQAGGKIDAIGTATDVYSLGAILYNVLTNRAPLSGDNLSEFLRRVAINDFPAPQAINQRVPKALSAVCLKALATDPADRYASARDFGADVDRWLADEPVLALPETQLERFSRFARRNSRWLAPLGIAIAVVAIVAFVAAAAINRSRLRAEAATIAETKARQRADANFLKARETVDSWLTGYTEALQNVPVAGVQQVRTRMLELASTQYEAFVAEKTDDPTLKLEQGRTLVRLGSLYRMLGHVEDAKARLDAATKVLQALATEKSSSPDAAQSLALARGMQALIAADQGKWGEADEQFAAAIKELEAARTQHADNGGFLAPLATLWTNRGGVLAKADHFPEADAAFENALSLTDELVRLAPNDLTARVAAATAQIGAGQVELMQGQARQAEQILQRAASFFSAATDLDDRDGRYLQLAVTAHGIRAGALRRLGDVRGEQDAYGKAIEAATQLARLQPEAPGLRVNLGMMKTDLGQALVEQFEAARAEPMLKEAVELLAAVVSEYPAFADYREALAGAYANLGQALQSLGRYNDAIMAYDKAAAELAGLQKAFPDATPYRERAAVVESGAAQSLFLADRRDQAAARFAAAAKMYDDLALSAEPSVDRSRAAAVSFSRYGDATIESDAAAADAAFDRASKEWSFILQTSSDPQFSAEAAWFFAACPSEKFRDAARAESLAAAPLHDAPANFRYRIALAFAQASAERWTDCAATIAAAPETFAGPALGFIKALDRAAAGKQDEAQTEFVQASTWLAANLPGEWDLRATEAAAKRRLQSEKPPDEPASNSSN